MHKSVWVSGIAAVVAFVSGISGLSADQLWSVHGGTTVILLDTSTLSQLGLRVESTDPDNFPAPQGQILMPVASDTNEFLLGGYDSENPQFRNGELHHRDGLIVIGPAGRVVIRDLIVGMVQGHAATGSLENQLLATTSITTFDKTSARLAVQCDSLVISRVLAVSLGVPTAAGRSIGDMQTNVDMAYMGGDPIPPGDDLPAPHICTNPVQGPDVIVGDMPAIQNYTPASGMDAFAVATTSCNMGNVNLLWNASSTNHPVIPQHMYRMKTVDGSVRFEQIGLSWMKHGFTALTGNVCCTCTNPGSGSFLGPGCSDPYSASRNGTQVTTTGGCGPRFQTNPHTGAFVWPYMFRGTGTMGGSSDPSTISRRLQVPLVDVNPTQNTGASYFVETQYITPDDAAAMNQNNNVSYRPCTITGSATDTTATVSGTTVRQKAAIQAWKTADPTVTETIIDTPEDNTVVNYPGRGILSAKATSLGGGIWHYEYALYNMNSDRGFTSFAVPIPSNYTVTNIGFHDVHYHSGDGFGTAVGALVTIDGTDWPGVFANGMVKWDCQKLVAPANINNSNYLRWGTTYNFRFDTNAPPSTGDITVEFFKAVAGQPDSMTVATVIPLPICDAPVIDPIPAQNASCGSAFTSSTPTTSGTGPFTWTISAGGQPGMTIAANTGVVSWPSPVASASPYVLTLRAASNCSAAVDTEEMSITVPFATDPEIDPIAAQNATCGSAFTSATPTGTGLAGAVWSITLGGQLGMTIDSSGVIHWPSPVPNASPYNVTIQATNACAVNPTDTAVVSITVPFAADPVIDPVPPQNGTCGTAFTSATPTGSGLAGAAWSITQGGQPGMTINSSGVISWPAPVPSNSAYNVTIQASHPCAANTATTVVSITIAFGPTPTVLPIAADSTYCGQPYGSGFPLATGGTPPYTWSMQGAPAGMTIDPSTGQITWPIPVVSPTPYNITVEASYACGAGPGSAVFVLTVRLGDFDGNGQLNYDDVPLFIDHLLGIDAFTPCAGDMNGDGNLDGLDIQGFVSQL